MIVRALDQNGDWTFGKGKNDYLSGNAAIAQCIQTRLKMFLGDCFFNLAGWVDWFNLLGSKNEVALNLAVSAVILNSPNVTGLMQLSINLDVNRLLTIQYSVTVATPVVSDQLLTATVSYLLDEFGNILTTESGDPLID